MHESVPMVLKSLVTIYVGVSGVKPTRVPPSPPVSYEGGARFCGSVRCTAPKRWLPWSKIYTSMSIDFP